MSQGGALRSRNKQKKQKRGDSGANSDPAEPTKEEKQVAKYLRFNMKTKEGICLGNQVAYFAGCKAVDALMASKWASATKKDDSVLFPNRKACIEYCQNLLEKDLFRRVIRIRRRNKKTEGVKEKEKKKGQKDKKKQPEEAANKEEAEQAEGTTTTTTTAKAEEQAEETTTTTTTAPSSKPAKKPKRPAKLDPHEEQVFVDGTEADEALYVWIFDPVSTKTYLLGTAVIIGAIAACLYPLWPMQLRIGIYYVCLGLIGLLGLLIALAIVRFVLFAGIWCATLGKRHFWLYPNLFEDVGFFDSFKPMYSISTPSDSKKKSSSSSKKGGEDLSDEKGGQSSKESTAAAASIATEQDQQKQQQQQETAEEIVEKVGGGESAGEFELVEPNSSDGDFDQMPAPPPPPPPATKARADKSDDDQSEPEEGGEEEEEEDYVNNE